MQTAAENGELSAKRSKSDESENEKDGKLKGEEDGNDKDLVVVGRKWWQRWQLLGGGGVKS